MTRDHEGSVLVSRERDSSSATITDCPCSKEVSSPGPCQPCTSHMEPFHLFLPDGVHGQCGGAQPFASSPPRGHFERPAHSHHVHSINASSTPLATEIIQSSHNSFKVIGSDLSDATVETSPSSLDDYVDSSISSPNATVSAAFPAHYACDFSAHGSAPALSSHETVLLGAGPDVKGAHVGLGLPLSLSRETLEKPSHSLDPRLDPNFGLGDTNNAGILPPDQAPSKVGQDHAFTNAVFAKQDIIIPGILQPAPFTELSKTASPFSSVSNEVNRVNQVNEVNEVNQVNEVNEVNEVNGVNEINEVNEVNQVNEVNEINQVNQVNQVNGVNDTNEINEVNGVNDTNETKPNIPDPDTHSKSNSTDLHPPTKETENQSQPAKETCAEKSPLSTMESDLTPLDVSVSPSQDQDRLSPLLSEMHPTLPHSLKPMKRLDGDPNDYFAPVHLNESPNPLNAATVPTRPSHTRPSPGLRLAPDIMPSEGYRHHGPALAEHPRLRSSFSIIRNSTRRRHARSSAHFDDDRVLVGHRISEGHQNYILAYNMLTGIRVAVSRNANVRPKLGAADFAASMKLTFNTDGSEMTPLSRYDFKFKDYAPNVFREMRALFGLDPADYLVSITGKYILLELGSPGKSGLFFYYSRDFRFIIKTIKHSEHKQLLRILQRYHAHIKANPNTLVLQFFGLHRVKMPTGHGGLRKVHFVVMNNLFAPHRDIHVKYDLKGSTWGRSTPVPTSSTDLSQLTLKDLNWLDRKDYIQFGPRKKQLFFAQLDRDVAFLQHVNVMDYSLLLGIHDTRQGNSGDMALKLSVFDPVLADKSDVINTEPRDLDREHELPQHVYPGRLTYVFYGHDGGIRATDGDNGPLPQIYYLGIIDCLTRYSLKKRIETFVRSLLHSRATISAVPAREYGARFLKFIKGGTRAPQHKEA